MGQVTDRVNFLVSNFTFFSGVTVVSLQGGEVARYATGSVAADQRGGVTGRLREYFSDRLFDKRPFVFQPFDVDRTDTSTLTISLAGGPRATMVLHSWGDTTFGFPVQDQGEVFFGSGDPVGPVPGRAGFLIAVGPPTHVGVTDPGAPEAGGS
ncbi:hypothetical protein ACSNOK_18050 [Streptomyces sp. URMC 126]|uniref:hypothetical protein n=1 Tax=Streptomyces sp. URMC 126 TaxID=3423401 RepID=UPI003F1DC74C